MSKVASRACKTPTCSDTVMSVQKSFASRNKEQIQIMSEINAGTHRNNVSPMKMFDQINRQRSREIRNKDSDQKVTNKVR